jgi:aspartate 1-decarboxylase
MRTYVSAKIHDLVVTDAHLRYTGSVTIDSDLLQYAGIDPYEQVDVVNLNNGNRWTTYVIPGGPGKFSLNGGGARLGLAGDLCVVMTYRTSEVFEGARALFVDADNALDHVIEYT